MKVDEGFYRMILGAALTAGIGICTQISPVLADSAGEIEESSQADEEVLENLEFLESLEFLGEDLALLEDYEVIDEAEVQSHDQ